MVGLAFFDPVKGLLLGVYTHGEPTCAVRQDAVLDGEFVRGEALRGPPSGGAQKHNEGLLKTNSPIHQESLRLQNSTFSKENHVLQPMTDVVRVLTF